MADIILIIAVTAAVFAAVAYIVRKRKKGECVGCSACSRRENGCAGCPQAEEKKR